MTPEELYSRIGGNYDEAKKRLMNDKLIAKFVVKFLDDPSFGQLKEAWDTQDGEAIFKASHGLKGVTANLALTALCKPASALCELYRGGATPEDQSVADELMASVVNQYESNIAAISEFAQAQ